MLLDGESIDVHVRVQPTKSVVLFSWQICNGQMVDTGTEWRHWWEETCAVCKLFFSVWTLLWSIGKGHQHDDGVSQVGVSNGFRRDKYCSVRGFPEALHHVSHGLWMACVHMKDTTKYLEPTVRLQMSYKTTFKRSDSLFNYSPLWTAPVNTEGHGLKTPTNTSPPRFPNQNLLCVLRTWP